MITGLINLLLLIDGLIYDLVVWVYEIFEFLTKTNLFDNDLYSDIVKRVYIVLGLIMMFALAYSLLKAVINPDEFSKGETSFPHLIKNVVTSLAIIAVLPTIFTVVFNIQNSLINQNTLPKLVMGDSYGGGEYKNGGRVIAYNAFTAFLHVNEDSCVSSSKVNDPSELTEDMIDTCAKAIKTNNETFSWGDITSWHALINADSEGTDNFYYISKGVEGYDVSFAYFNQFGKAVLSGQLTYTMIISTICGIFLLYVIANFCFDMALRVIKLMFFQIIAPIPVVCRVIPGGKMKDVFSTWVRKTASTFLDVFVRIFVMYLGIFVIDQFVNNWDSISRGNLGFVQALIAKALVIMGIVAFIRQAPKLLAEIFHLDAGDMKLGLMDKLAMGGALTAGAVVGGGIGSLGRNAVSAVKDFHSTKGQGWKKRTGSALRGAASTLAGGASGAFRGGKGGLNAKNFGDMKKAAGDAVAGASAAKAKREKYRAEHLSEHGALATLGNVMLGHAIVDPLNNAARFFGATGLEALQDDNKAIDDINSKKKAIRTTAEELIIGESNKQGVAKNFGLTSKAKINGRDVDFRTDILRSMRQKMETARASGAADAGYLQDEYDSYLKQFTDAVQNQALLGQKSFNSVLSGLSADDARALEADLGEVRSAASSFRRSVKDNLTASYVSDIGFNASMLADGSDLNLNDAPMKALGDTLKIAKQKNNDEINKIINNQQKQNGNQ